MHHVAAGTVKWIGRLLLLAIPFLIVSALLWPRGIQFLNPAVCKDGMSLNNRNGLGSVELTCRGDGAVDNVTLELAVVVIGLALLSAAAYYLASRLAHPRAKRPRTVAHQ